VDDQLSLILIVAVSAGIASPLGGAAVLLFKPTTLLLSIFVGFAAGVLIGTLAFEMMPKALAQASLWASAAGFAVGFGIVYALDLFVNRGALAGEMAAEKVDVKAHHARRKPRGGKVTVLAGATSAEEIIEGLAIGVGSAIDPTVALLTGLAIGIDNVAEALSIGALQREEDGEHFVWPTLKWTGLIGVTLVTSAMIGWFALRGLSQGVLGFLLAVGAGGMLYLTVTDLIPEAEDHSYQESGAISLAAGFLAIFILSTLM
jgi:ZIP family zinc transporter